MITMILVIADLSDGVKMPSISFESRLFYLPSPLCLLQYL